MKTKTKDKANHSQRTENGNGVGRFWLLLESFSVVPQHSTASQEELGCRHFKSVPNANANSGISLFCRRFSPAELLLLRGQSSMVLPVSLHMALGDELLTQDEEEEPQPKAWFLRQVSQSSGEGSKPAG